MSFRNLEVSTYSDLLPNSGASRDDLEIQWSGEEKSSPSSPPESSSRGYDASRLRGKEVTDKAHARRARTYKNNSGSQFCHICSQKPSKKGGKLVCSKTSKGLCRKTVCEKCLRRHGWDYDAIVKDPSKWICPHCTNTCPERSQCRTYERVNAEKKNKKPRQKEGSFANAIAKADFMQENGSSSRELRLTNDKILQKPLDPKLRLG